MQHMICTKICRSVLVVVVFISSNGVLILNDQLHVHGLSSLS